MKGIMYHLWPEQMSRQIAATPKGRTMDSLWWFVVVWRGHTPRAGMFNINLQFVLFNCQHSRLLWGGLGPIGGIQMSVSLCPRAPVCVIIIMIIIMVAVLITDANRRNGPECWLHEWTKSIGQSVSIGCALLSVHNGPPARCPAPVYIQLWITRSTDHWAFVVANPLTRVNGLLLLAMSQSLVDRFKMNTNLKLVQPIRCRLHQQQPGCHTGNN